MIKDILGEDPDRRSSPKMSFLLERNGNTKKQLTGKRRFYKLI